ncbi:MAG: hypothetical protein QXQ81_07735, partial [Candidatus Thorarchaeota archaeon]
ATAIWENGTVLLTHVGNGVYRFGPSETGISRLEIRSLPYYITVIMSKGNYSREQVTVGIVIRPIRTQIMILSAPVEVYVGQEFTVTITYWDLDHNLPIAGAMNSTTGTQLVRVGRLDKMYGNGTYVFGFMGRSVQQYLLKIALSKTDYSVAEATLVVFVLLSPEQQMLTTSIFYGALLIMAAVALGTAYVRVWSVPKLLRRIRSMIKALDKGVIPTAPPVRDRRSLILSFMNEDLRPLSIVKGEEDLARSTVDVTVLDVDLLLEELRAVVGLTDSDIAVLREDLEKMRPSERAGFISEVIKQERARRAREIAESTRPPEERAAMARKPTEEELALFKEKLLAMGIEETEADLMVEQARTLTKAEIDALLDQIGGDKD